MFCVSKPFFCCIISIQINYLNFVVDWVGCKNIKSGLKKWLALSRFNGDRLMVAEGNAGNKNVLGIITRKRDDSIGCYIRIPKDYKYDGWKINFKTGEEKIVNYTEE